MCLNVSPAKAYCRASVVLDTDYSHCFQLGYWKEIEIILTWRALTVSAHANSATCSSYQQPPQLPPGFFALHITMHLMAQNRIGADMGAVRRCGVMELLQAVGNLRLRMEHGCLLRSEVGI